MTRPGRRPSSITGLMGFVALLAIGLGALRAETDPARAVLLSMLLGGMLLFVRAIVD